MSEIRDLRLFSVWGNSEFTYEFVKELGCMRGRTVILFDLDFIHPCMMEFFGLKPSEDNSQFKRDQEVGASGVVATKKTSIEMLMEAAKVKGLCKSTFEALASRAKGSKVCVVEGLASMFKYEYVDMDLVKRVIVESMKYYDYVILNTNQHIYDGGTVLGFEIADVILRPLGSSRAELKSYNEIMRFLRDRAPGLSKKFRVVGYEPRSKTIDSDFLRESAEFYIGDVDHDSARKRQGQFDCLLRNLKLKEMDYVSYSVLQ